MQGMEDEIIGGVNYQKDQDQKIIIHEDCYGNMLNHVEHSVEHLCSEGLHI